MPDSLASLIHSWRSCWHIYVSDAELEMLRDALSDKHVQLTEQIRSIKEGMTYVYYGDERICTDSRDEAALAQATKDQAAVANLLARFPP